MEQFVSKNRTIFVKELPIDDKSIRIFKSYSFSSHLKKFSSSMRSRNWKRVKILSYFYIDLRLIGSNIIFIWY